MQYYFHNNTIIVATHRELLSWENDYTFAQTPGAAAMKPEAR